MRDIQGAVRQAGVREHNERLVLTTIQRHGAMPSADVARVTGLSAQTASVITRALDADGLLQKGDPVRGRVGKPSVPMALNRDGAFSIGLRLGRRSANLILMDLTGGERAHHDTTYPYPTPDRVRSFIADGMPRLLGALTPEQATRIAGIGVAAPNELWNWLDVVNAPQAEMAGWKEFSFADTFAQYTDLPVQVGNDGTLACNAEHLMGQGRGLMDYAYLFIGSFAGGGIVLNGMVYPGRNGNAGAFGSMPVGDASKPGNQLIQQASIYLLEQRLMAAGLQYSGLWLEASDWSGLEPVLDAWLADTASALAKACAAIVSVIDFGSVVIDGSFPPDIRAKLVALVTKELTRTDMQGLVPPLVLAGSIGRKSGAFGAAYQPLLSRFLLNTPLQTVTAPA